MVPLIQGVSHELLAAVKADALTGEKTDLKTMMGKFSMGAIASCAFGLDAKTFGKNESPFVEHSKNFFRMDPKEMFKFAAYTVPGVNYILQKAGIPLSKEKETMFFHKVVTSVIEERKRNPSLRRNDMVDMMMDVMASKDNGSTNATGQSVSYNKS